MIDRDFLEKQLAAMRKEHRKLDKIISNFAENENTPDDRIELQLLKKRKLLLKDSIARLDSALLPNIIA